MLEINKINFVKEILVGLSASLYTCPSIYTTQNLFRITFSFNDLMLKTNRLKKDFFIKIG